MKPLEGTDARYRLAQLLLNPAVRQRYAVIILDMPPRLTLGSVNALVASHHLLIPTMLDMLSAEAVRQFSATAKAIKDDMNLDLDLLGTVATMTQKRPDLTPRERLAWDRVQEACQSTWDERDHRFKRWIPARADIAAAAGYDVAYISDNQSASIFSELGDQVWARLFPRADEPAEPGDQQLAE
jgi:cellulose biosynthesis protein BcsQ